jgi:hypothetical protein
MTSAIGFTVTSAFALRSFGFGLAAAALRPVPKGSIYITDDRQVRNPTSLQK